jgi:hypothetical protein
MARPRLRWIVPTHDQDGGSRPDQPRGGTIRARPGSLPESRAFRSGLEEHMNGIIYLVGLIVVIMFILSFLGLR